MAHAGGAQSDARRSDVGWIRASRDRPGGIQVGIAECPQRRERSVTEAAAAPKARPHDDARASGLELALRGMGFRCSVEAIDRLAVLLADDPEAEGELTTRRREALRTIGAHGFTHLALEVQAEPAERAPLHRD